MMTMTRHAALALMLGFALVAGCDATLNEEIVIPAGATDASGGTSVNGGVRVGDGARVPGADFRTVNGRIEIGANAVVGDCATVNGRVDIGHDTETGALQTVNGGVRAAANVKVHGDVEVVNGGVRFAEGSVVAGSVMSVNGDLALHGTQVGGDITKVTGDILLTDGSTLEGRLLVKKDTGNHGDRPPRIVIGPGTRVLGGMEFRRPVELHVHDTAETGPVVGAEPVRFSGDAPGNG